ncbi:hypothetical protein B0H14DRAFT_2656804, partial [Mycena olivaceomarginata]
LNGNGKRIGEEHSEAPAVKKVMLLVPMLAQVQGKMREAGIGAGGGAATGGDRKARCPRKGDGVGIGGDNDIGDVDSRTAKSKKGLSKSKSKGKGKEKGKSKHPLGYTIKGTGPPLTKDAGFLLKLSAGTNLPSVVSKLNALGTKNQITSFWYMVNLVQLAMHIHSIREDCTHKHLHVPSYNRFAWEYGGSSPFTFKQRLESGTLYIWVIIAATSMQEDFISRSKTLCSALREVSLCIRPDEKWGPLVNHLRVPLEYI